VFGFDRIALRKHASGYGSDRLGRATTCAHALRFEAAQLGPLRAARTLWQLPALFAYLLGLARVDVRLSDDPAGLAIREHLALRRWGFPRFRLAQGILQLPPDFANYLRGRRRQALRTNMRRSTDRGIECHSRTVAAWRRHEPGVTKLAPVEHWWATGSNGATVGEAWLTIDRECALLHGLTSAEPYARWSLHTAIVERLCQSGRNMLITNSFDAPLMGPGQQYFQRLLGYSIARLRPRRLARPRTLCASVPIPRLVALAAFAALVAATAAIVGQQLLSA
jgi:hypothetical protein